MESLPRDGQPRGRHKFTDIISSIFLGPGILSFYKKTIERAPFSARVETGLPQRSPGGCTKLLKIGLYTVSPLRSSPAKDSTFSLLSADTIGDS